MSVHCRECGEPMGRGFIHFCPTMEDKVRRTPDDAPTSYSSSTVLIVLGALSVVGAIIAFGVARAKAVQAAQNRTSDNFAISLGNGINGTHNSLLSGAATNYAPAIVLLVLAALLITWGVIMRGHGD